MKNLTDSVAVVVPAVVPPVVPAVVPAAGAAAFTAAITAAVAAAAVAEVDTNPRSGFGRGATGPDGADLAGQCLVAEMS